MKTTRAVSALLSVLILAPTMPALAAGFPDVSQNHPYYDAIEYLRTHDTVHGYPDGTFHADATINRAEFVKIITNALTPGSTSSQCARSNEFFLPYSDVHQADWFAFRVCLATALSIVSGYPDGTFRPAASINFVEAAKIIVNAADIASDAGHTVPSEPWYKAFVVDLEVRNAIPTSITRFDQPITRGEMAEIIYRLKTNLTNKSSQTYEKLSREKSNDWKTFNSQYFTLSFNIPQDYTVEDLPNYIGVFPPQPPLRGDEQEGEGTPAELLSLLRYVGTETKTSEIEDAKEGLKNLVQDTVMVDGNSFTRIRGHGFNIINGQTEISPGTIEYIFFPKSMLEIIQGNDISDHIVSTMKFVSATK